MHRTKKFQVCIGLAVVLFIGSTGRMALAGDANSTVAVSFPYTARVIGENVFFRSGPGINYYQCGTFENGQTVTVVAEQFGWCRIIPPPGSFSWISKRYVTVDTANPKQGTVTADNVRVYSGSESVDPLHSTLQVKLNKAEKVRLLGEEKDDYYKIASPADVYLWVKSEYTEPVEPQAAAAVTAQPAPELPQGTSVGASVQGTSSQGTSVVETNLPPGEARMLEQFRAVQKQLETERAKPLQQQNYAQIKQALAGITADKNAGKAARYADFALKQVERCELALEVAETVRLQDTQFQQVAQRLEEARQAKLAEVNDLDIGRFAVIGRLEGSAIYTGQPRSRHYRIVDDQGSTVCYAVPGGPAEQTDISRFTDHKVGLVGTIEPYRQTSGALVTFTEAVILD